jgi:hypothetical protein
MYDLDSVSLEMWIDMPRRLVLTREFVEWFAEELRFDAIGLMIDDSDKDVEFSWKPQHIERLLNMLDRHAIELCLVTWPYPDKDQLLEMKRKLWELFAVGPVAEWETDQEGNWHESKVVGFDGHPSRTPYDLAGDFLHDIKVEAKKEFGVRDALTTFTYHIENGPHADVAGLVDRLRVQAYAVDERDGLIVGFNDRLGPGGMQELTLGKTMKVPGVSEGHPELCVGHAAWKQDGFLREGKPVPPEEAMRTSFEASLKFSPVAHSWWSGKFAYPKSRLYNGSDKFLKTLRADT